MSIDGGPSGRGVKHNYARQLNGVQIEGSGVSQSILLQMACNESCIDIISVVCSLVSAS